MPKLKTHSGAKKRFNITKTGKVKRAKAFKSHILTKKDTKRTRRLRAGGYADVTNRRNKVLKLAKGYWGSKSKHFKMANQAVMKSLTYAYTGRKLKKRDFRSLWITRISAACKMNGMNYSTFMHGLKVAGIEINRKMLSEMAISNPAAFTQLIEIAKKA